MTSFSAPDALSVAERPSRLLSLDVLRGLTVAGMILVTDPGTYAHVFPQLTHAPWNDPTATDLIFPCFLVMVGISVDLSFRSRLDRGASMQQLTLRALRRAVLLILVGLLVNAFPDFRFRDFRFAGILQRIGVCYFAAAALWGATAWKRVSRRHRQVVFVGAGLLSLGVYWSLLKLYPTPGFGAGHLDPVGNIASVLDRHLFGIQHIFQWGIRTPGFGVSSDPEGVLSTLGAVAATLFGVAAGEELVRDGHRAQQSRAIASAGVVLWLLSLLLRPAMPINKPLFTPTFALWSTGLSLVAFAGLLWLIDVRQVRRGWTFALIFGSNAILAFLLSQVLTTVLSRSHLPTAPATPLYMAADALLFGSWLPPRMASLLWAVCVVLLNAAILYPLYRRRIFFRL